MRNLNTTDFKAGCLALLDEVARTGEILTITKRGKPVAQIVPIRPSNRRYPQDMLGRTVETLGDIISPALDSRAWEAERPRRR
jgi:prevent-host-death family protein